MMNVKLTEDSILDNDLLFLNINLSQIKKEDGFQIFTFIRTYEQECFE